MSDGNTDVCRLCGTESVLCESHIIPKFVFRWMKKTSGTGYLRFGGNMNRRSQDGLKPKLLCNSCEQKFSVWEKKFSETYFAIATSSELPSGSYDEWLSKFCASVTWRVAIWCKEFGNFSEFKPQEQKRVNDAILTWKRFLNSELPNPGKNELHLIPVGGFAQIRHPKLPPNWNRYTRRQTELDTIFTESGNFSSIYVKMGPVAIFGHLHNQGPKWSGSRVAIKHGSFVIDARLPDTVLEYLFDRAINTRRLQSKMSDKQKSVIETSILANPDRIVASDLFQDIQNDVALFGKNAFID